MAPTEVVGAVLQGNHLAVQQRVNVMPHHVMPHHTHQGTLPGSVETFLVTNPHFLDKHCRQKEIKINLCWQVPGHSHKATSASTTANTHFWGRTAPCC